MISFSSDEITVGRNGVSETSHGPYGYLCLGLVYLWNDEDKCLDIDKIILAEVDLKLRCAIVFSLYYDMFREPFSEVYEENGFFFYHGLPIVNYKQLNIPKKVTGVKENPYNSYEENTKYFYNNEGPLQYSINRINGNKCGNAFDTRYQELYSCVLDFDEETLEGTALGFETLGKITPLNNKQSVDNLYKELICNRIYSYSYEDDYEEICKRYSEFGFLNLSYELDDQGNKKYTYTSIWDDVDALIALNAQEKEETETSQDT